AHALLRQGDLTHAASSYEQFQKSGGRLDSGFYRNRGAAFAARGRLWDALADYTLARELRPDADVCSRRGWVYVMLRSHDAAGSDFAEALRFAPHSREALIGRGYVRAVAGDSRAAVQDAEAAQAGPGPLASHQLYNLACLYAQAFDRARDDEYRRRAFAN